MPGPYPDQVVHRRRRVDTRIGDSVVEAEKVSWHASRPWRAYETINAPARLHHPTRVLGDVPKRMDDGIGIGGIQDEAQIALALARIEVVVRKRSHGLQHCRLGSCESVPRVEQGRSHANRCRQLVAGDHRSQDPIVRRRRRGSGIWRHATGHEYSNTVREGVEKLHHVGTSRSDDVECHKNPGMRGQGGDDFLVLAMKWMGLVRLD